MNISPLNKQQALKVVKALLYSFASGFVAVLALQAVDFIQAASQGTAAVIDLLVALISGAVVGGINAVAVAVKQLFTPTN